MKGSIPSARRKKPLRSTFLGIHVNVIDIIPPYSEYLTKHAYFFLQKSQSAPNHEVIYMPQNQFQRGMHLLHIMLSPTTSVARFIQVST